MTIHKIISVSLLGCVLVLGACDKGGAKKDDKQAKTNTNAKTPATKTDGDEPPPEPEEPAPELDPKVEQAVTLANQISANPGEADDILDQAGMDREAYEALLYEIAKDPELSKSYAVARESA